MKNILITNLAILIVTKLFSQIPTNNLMSYHTFDNKLNDSSINNITITVSSSSFTSDRFGNPNAAIVLNNSYVAYPSGFYDGGELSYSAWVKIASFGAYSRLFEFGTPWTSNATNRIVLRTGNFDGNLTLEVVSLAETPAWLSLSVPTSENLKLNTWYHVALSKKGAVYNVFLNNIKLITTTGGVLTAQGSNNYLNNFLNNSNRTFADTRSNITYDDVRFYNKALSDLEISALFNEGVTTDMEGGETASSTENIVLYPNPATTDVLYLKIDNVKGSESEIEILDLYGRVLCSSHIQKSRFVPLDVSAFENGTYFVKAQIGNSIKVKSFILAK